MEVMLRFVLPSDAAFVQEYASSPQMSETSNVPYPYPDGGEENL
ncbi:hypothetical protein ACN9MH_11705 [Paenibacillus silvae]|jgi:hypothetical protein|nr:MULTISPECIES: hypothetical protein [Paenibacillus]MDM5278273.1 hypothetical protein [Paenibacillus silvae]